MMLLKNMVRGSENDSVAKQLIQSWEHDTDTLKFWRASSNFIYLFERTDVRHFLRFIHEEDNTIENIQAELDFLKHLIANGYPASAEHMGLIHYDFETDNIFYDEEESCYYTIDFDDSMIHWVRDGYCIRHHRSGRARR